MSLIYKIYSLAREMEVQNKAASDLWTYLPSYKAAVGIHGYRPSEYQPSVADVIKEAAILLSLLWPVERVDKFVVVGLDSFNVFGRGGNYDSALNDALKSGVSASRVLVVPERRLPEFRELFCCPCEECQGSFFSEEEEKL